MKATAKLVLKVEDFKVERQVQVSNLGEIGAKEARGSLETEVREALGDLCNLVYDEILRRKVPADARQTAIPGTERKKK